ncbi:MAG: carboxylating nicotinate-nucleotide diphosphorylase [Terriglobales bacterium]
MDWNTAAVRALLECALGEDHAGNDITTLSTVPAEARAQAAIVAKQECVLAGLGVVPQVFATFGAEVEYEPADGITDGARLLVGATAARLRGGARPLLSCERVILNLLQRMSGIATLTRRYVDAVAGCPAIILDTRKTAPGLRLFDKYAVTCGGGRNHRPDLSGAVLIKNNHIRLAGGVKPAMARMRQNGRPEPSVEIEVRTLAELEEALACGAGRILLDNMSPAQVTEAVRVIGGRVPVEVSGGVRLDTVRAYAETGVDFISVGELTHSAPAVDLAMRIVPLL